MNSGLVHSELNYNFRLFAKTISSSAAWGFDRFRLFTSKWHTKIQVRRLDGSVVATQSFAPDGAFEHTFSFDLSGNVTNEEYSVYIAGIAVGQNFNQAYAWPTGYSATTGKNAELTYWDFSQVNIVFSGTSGRIRFENNPITNIDGASLLNAGEINFANCQLGAETLADMLIGLDTTGGTGGSFIYSGNLAAPASRGLMAYNSLKDTKAWTLTGAIPAAAFEAETTAYLDAITIANDSTIFYAATPQEITGSEIWAAVDAFVAGLKTDGLFSQMKAIYPLIGDTAVTHKYNLLDIADTNIAGRLTFFGSVVHSKTGIKGNGSNAYANTNLKHSSVFSIGSESFGTYLRTEITEEGCEIGVMNGSGLGGAHLFADFDATRGLISRSQAETTGGNDAVFANSSTLGLHLENRNNVDDYIVRKRDQRLTIIEPATNLYDLDFYMLRRNSSTPYYSTKEISFAFMANGLTLAQENALTTRVNNFQTALKRNV